MVQETLFTSAILTLLVETCLKETYKKDIETYLQFLQFVKLYAKKNTRFYESFGKDSQIYTPVINLFASFMGQVNGATKF